MKEREAKEGVRVKYTDGHYGGGPSNPIWGSGDGYIAGTISDARGGHVEVTWDSGRTNNYHVNHLELLSTEEGCYHPGHCEEIWL